jgi:protein phosphatase PTC7
LITKIIEMKSLGRFVIAGLYVVAAAFEHGAYFESRTIIIPHDDKIQRGGEDSAHVTDTMIAVADGVGGWADSGVNPGLFSKLLTRTIKELHLKNPQKNTRKLAIEAHRVAATKFAGSSTLVVVKIDSEDTISTTIIGDSGYALFHVMTQESGSQILQLYFRAEEQ